MGRRRSSPANRLFEWVWRRSMKVKIFMAVIFVLCSLLAPALFVKKSNHFPLASESIHAVGILVLIYKLTTKKTCSGLSLKTQELTAIFLAARMCCSFAIKAGIHTWLDFSSFVSTAWVIYMIRFKLKSSYIAELDSLAIYYMVIPSAILAIFVHPLGIYGLHYNILWAFNVFLESVSVLPQLRLIQKAKMVEPFTGHYVFALGVSRFLGFAQWMIQVYESGGAFLYLIGRGHLWVLLALLAEIVQTFILADFCYYYIKSVMNGQLVVSLPPV